MYAPGSPVIASLQEAPVPSLLVEEEALGTLIVFPSFSSPSFVLPPAEGKDSL